MTTTDPDLAALLRAVIASPADDGPRLAYADRLEECGEAERSEFIRVQCELARVNVDDHAIRYWDGQLGQEPEHYQRVKTLRRRERELRESFPNYRDWVADIERSVGESVADLDYSGQREWSPRWFVRFRRGFIAEVHTTLADWCGKTCPKCMGVCKLRHPNGIMQFLPCSTCLGTGRSGGHGPAIVACQPVGSVVLTDRTPYHNVAGVWIWVSSAAGSGRMDSAVLPRELYSMLEASVDIVSRMRGVATAYATQALALDALSLAALAWARDRAAQEATR